MLSVIFQVPRPQSLVIFIQILTLWIAEWPKQAQAIVVCVCVGGYHKDMSRFARERMSCLGSRVCLTPWPQLRPH